MDGSELIQAEAYGKHLFLHFSAATPAHIVHIHLGLIGKLYFEDADAEWGQIRLHITLADAAPSAPAANLRGPQWCRLITEEGYAKALSTVGQDPIREDADPAALWKRVHRSQRTMASLLMDQKLFAGVGNIYRAEVLFRQGMSPFLPGADLTRAQFEAIWEDLVELMRYGAEVSRIDTVFPQHTPEAMGRPPRKDDHGGEVYVYRRAGQPCHVCGTPVSMQVFEGRNLFWCPHCQQS